MRNKTVRGLVIAATLAAVLPLLGGTAAAAPAGRDERGVFANASGLVQYEVHLPPSYRPDTPMPVVLALHGCLMSGYGANSMKSLSRFDQLADTKGFIVVYPTQNPLRNLVGCWNAFSPDHQHRGSGEPSLLAGVVEEVVGRYHADAKRVHVTGASSGAGMAVILAATYPDVFASAASLAGGEYAFHLVADDPEGTTPIDTAKLAHAEMGPRARQVPLLVEQGTADTTVPPFVADRLVSHWAAVSDLATDGQLDGEVDDVADTTENVARPGEHPYAHTSYTAADGGPPLIEKYVVEGLEHKWPAGGPGRFSDPMGPDITAIMWDFFDSRVLP